MSFVARTIHRLLKRPWRFFSVATRLCVVVLLCAIAAGLFSLTVPPVSQADTGIVRPNADGSVSGTRTGCDTANNYDCVDEVITNPTAPSTGSDYVTLVNNGTDQYLLTTLTDVQTVTSVTVHYYHVEGGTNAQQTIGLYAADGFTQYGTTQNIPIRTSGQWDTATIGSLSLNQSQLDGLQVRVSCTKIGGGTSNTCTGYALYAVVTYDPVIHATIGTLGTQVNIDAGTNNAYIGGSFSIVNNVGTRNVTSITINETGTADAANNLKNIKLFYEMDTTAADGYNCSDQTYGGTETQFGSTVAGGFSGANGSATFTGSVGITTTSSMCIYVVMDVQSTAVAGNTIEVQITNPTTDVTLSAGNKSPATVVALPGITTIQKTVLTQIHYHWRNDDGNEAGATSATGNTQDTPNTALGKLVPIRLRLEVSNEGNKTSGSTQYRIEYGRKITTCSAITGGNWVDVGAGGGDWDMYDSANLTNGNNTSNVLLASLGAVADENDSFLSTNGGVRDTSSQTGGLTLTSTQFVEFEYSMVATSNATEGYNYCFRVTNAGTPIDAYTVYPEVTILADVTVTTDGTQQATIDIPTNNVQMGSRFIIKDNIAGNTSVTSITIAASGTVDYQNDIDNIRLYYDLDTTSGDGYNCSDQTYAGTEPQFGSTDTDGFSAGGLSSFTGSVTVNPTQTMCVYVVLDVTSGATNDESLDIKINNASTDVVIGSGTVAPAALVSMSGTTYMVTQSAQQLHYHWRNDNGSETGATSATNGSEDTTLLNLRQNIPRRLRIGISNEGSSTTPAYQYRLEYAVRTSVCAAATGWTQVGSGANPAFAMFNSSNITDGGNTTNIDVSQGGVTDEATTYLTTNGALKDTSAQTGNITLPGNNFVDLEYSLTATASSTEGATYCFRVTNAGTPLPAYVQYPKVSIQPKTDFYIQRGVTTLSGASATLTAGTEYVAPSSASRAFIRITNTLNTGAGGGATGNAKDTTVYISNPSNIMTSVTLTRPTGWTGSTRVTWEIIEYTGAPGGDNELVVRQQSTATYVSGNTTVTTSAASGVVTDADIVPFITGSINPDTGTNYQRSNSTAAWNGAGDTVTFTRGESGNTSAISYAVVEFTGNNWKIQRSEHNYSAVGSTETESITSVNSLSRTFLHSQKRMGTGRNTHGDYGHQVWLSSIGQISYVIDGTAVNANTHYSVAWVIENTQTVGQTVQVTRSSGTQSGGASPTTLNRDIGKTLSNIDIASIFMNNTGNEPGGGGGTNSFPEPMMSARIISTTQYELWIADTSDSRSWRTEIVEWPTASRNFEQNYYRFYENENALDPSTPWTGDIGPLGENTEVTVIDNPIESGEVMRLRMTVQISAAAMAPGLDSFKLQFGERTTVCSAIAEANWHDVGAIGSTTALWRGYNNAGVADGANLSTDPPAGGALNISIADVAGTYEEENDTVVTPFVVDPGEDVEFDWVVENNLALEKTDYCFRMTEASGTLFDGSGVGYNYYPVMRTAGYTPTLSVWRFYDDETNATPSTPLAAEDTAPIDVELLNPMKLRVTIAESTGGTGRDAKFKLQFSEYSNFSQGVYDVVATSTCTQNSLWCYADGAGVDNAVIANAVLSDADSCTGGTGNGCGTYNEGSASTTATYDQVAYSTAEYEYTIVHSGARANAVYYFRLVDQQSGLVVPASSTLPSVVTEGASLVFNVTGVTSGTVTEGETIDVTSTPGSIVYGVVPFNSEYTSAYRLQVDTNATEGYQIFMYSAQPLTNTYGTTIPSVTGSNALPVSWSTGCDSGATACFGYHAGDDSLEGGSARFGANDSYAALSTSPEEVMYSSIAQDSAHDIVYKLQVREDQPAGDYQTTINFLAIPIF